MYRFLSKNLGKEDLRMVKKEIALILGGQISKLEGIDLSDIHIFEQITMNQAIKLAKELEKDGVKAIISPGGTAIAIKKYISIPVIQADPTYFDILESLKCLEEKFGITNQNVAITCNHTRSIAIDRLQTFVKNYLAIYYYKNEDDLREKIYDALNKGYKAIVGGPTTLAIAQNLGMIGCLLYLGKETLLNAIDKAKLILEFRKKDYEQTTWLKTILNLSHEGILAVNNKGTVTLCNPKALDILQMNENEVLGNNICQITGDPSWNDVYEMGKVYIDKIKKYKNTNLFVTCQPVIVNNRIIGAIGTLQHVTKIEKMEHKYRKIQTKGLVAKFRFQDIIGKSDIIRKTIEQAKAYARTDFKILIEGETGVGKEIFAQSIHNFSNRKYGPFVAINCAALPENLLESELFGYEEGAFTGAKRGGKAGLFELAHKGTIFLDEINQLTPQLQARILRVIQEGQVMRLGGEQVIPVDVRIISATNEKLKPLINAGKFREDLYYRLNVLQLHIPPLRERKEDIPILLEHFLKKFSPSNKIIKGFSPSSLQILLNYPWPGNVRELINFVQRYIVLSKEFWESDLQYVIDFTNNNKDVESISNEEDLNILKIRLGSLNDMELQLIEQIMQRYSWNKKKVASLLGVSRTTLWKKIKELEEKDQV